MDFDQHLAEGLGILFKKVILVTETRGLCSIHHQQQHKKLRALGDEFLPRSNPVTGIFNSTAPAFGFAHGPDTKVNRLVKIEGILGELTSA